MTTTVPRMLLTSLAFTSILALGQVVSADPGDGTPEEVVRLGNEIIAELAASPYMNVRQGASVNAVETDEDGNEVNVKKIQGYQLLERFFSANKMSASTITSWTAAGSTLRVCTGSPPKCNSGVRDSWCGIMVNAIYLEARVPGVGPWKFNGSGFAGRSGEFKKLAPMDRVQAGDTCTKVAQSHHVLVMKSSGDTGAETLEILQGNGDYESITTVTASRKSFDSGCFRPLAWWE